MSANYAKIIEENLEKIYEKPDAADMLADALPGKKDGEAVYFNAFGESCRIEPEGIFLNDEKQDGPKGIVISLYALHAEKTPCELTPLRAFKDFPDSMPYVGAFNSHTQMPLVPHVEKIEGKIDTITKKLNGSPAPSDISADFAFLIYPLPKIALCYIFYEADEDFPASVTCLYSGNASKFIPIDGLADVGEYTSRKILEVLGR